MKFFSKFLLHFDSVEIGEKLWKKFFHFGSRWRHLPKGLVKKCFSAITSEVHIQLFFNLFFALVLCFQHANLMEEKFLKKS
jgi:hypothetical protein